MDAETISKIRTFGLEYYGRYYSIYEGIVTDNVDPQSQGRVKVKVPALGRDEPLKHFAYPCAPFAGNGFGTFFPPEVDSRVWIMFQGGDPGLPVYVGSWWLNPVRTSSTSQVPREANTQGQEPKVREIKTKNGHRIIFDEGTDPGILIQTAQGEIIRMRDNSQSIEIIASSEITIKTTSAKVQASSANISASSAKISSSVVDITASALNLSGSLTRINNGVSPVARVGDSVAGGSIKTGNPTILG